MLPVLQELQELLVLVLMPAQETVRVAQTAARMTAATVMQTAAAAAPFQVLQECRPAAASGQVLYKVRWSSWAS
jgi:hypothetical protein